MEKISINQIESQESDQNKITREQLVSFAKEKPRQDLEVKKMLIKWLEQTSIPENSTAESVKYIEVAIMHSAMKYRLGFISKEEVLEELEQAGEMLASEYVDTSELHNRLSQLMYSIEDNLFDIV